MSKIERIVVVILILAALAGIVFSYYVNISQKKIQIIPAESAREAERAKDIIAERNTININTADRDILTRLSGIGPQLAQRIIDYRREYGKFSSPDDIMKVKGIGPKKYEKIKDCIKADESR